MHNSCVLFWTHRSLFMHNLCALFWTHRSLFMHNSCVLFWTHRSFQNWTHVSIGPLVLRFRWLIRRTLLLVQRSFVHICTVRQTPRFSCVATCQTHYVQNWTHLSIGPLVLRFRWLIRHTLLLVQRSFVHIDTVRQTPRFSCVATCQTHCIIHLRLYAVRVISK
jgi:hypothetical protein